MTNDSQICIQEIDYYPKMSSHAQKQLGKVRVGGGMQPNTNTALALACQLLYCIDLLNLWYRTSTPIGESRKSTGYKIEWMTFKKIRFLASAMLLRSVSLVENDHFEKNKRYLEWK